MSRRARERQNSRPWDSGEEPEDYQDDDDDDDQQTGDASDGC